MRRMCRMLIAMCLMFTPCLFGLQPVGAIQPTYRIPSLTDEQEQPILCVDTGGGLKRKVIVAAWENGRVIWSDDPINGGKPYREAVLAPGTVTGVIADIEARGLLVPAENPCSRKVTTDHTTNFHVVLSSGSAVDETQHLQVEAGGSMVSTSHGPESLNGRTLEAVLEEDTECFRRFRARIDGLNAACLGLVPDNPESFPIRTCTFELRRPGDIASATRPTPVAPRHGHQWLPTGNEVLYSLQTTIRQDTPVFYLCTSLGANHAVYDVVALYADGTYMWAADPLDRSSYRMTTLDPTTAVTLSETLQSPPAFTGEEVSLLRAYNPRDFQILTYPDGTGTSRQIVSSHGFAEEQEQGYCQAIDGPSVLFQETFEEWLDGQPEAYRRFRLSWARVKDGLRALRPTDPAQSTALGEVTWTLTPIVPPTPSPTPP